MSTHNQRQSGVRAGPRILLSCQFPILRQGLRSLLSQWKKAEVVAEAADGWTCVHQARELAPDVVLICMNLPRLNAIDATRLITSADRDSRVILIAERSGHEHLREAAEAGALGFLFCHCDFDELTHAIDVVLDDRLYISPPVNRMLLDHYVKGQDANPCTAFSLLTLREREVLQLIAEGQSTKDVAHLLSVSVKTVESHRQQLMRKLEIRNVASLTKYAIREGLTSLEP